MGRRITFFSILLCLSVPMVAQVRSNPPDRTRTGSMLVLRLKKTGDTFELLSSRVVQTNRKFRSAPSGDYALTLVTADGSAAWKEAFDDPTPRLEFEDPARPGKLVRVPDTTHSFTFTLRVPFLPAVNAIELSRFTGTGTGMGRVEKQLERIELK